MLQIQNRVSLPANQEGGAVQQPGEINIHVKVVTGAGGNMQFDISMNTQAPFAIFQEFVKQHVFTSNQQSAFTNALLYQLENKHATIKEDEQLSLEQLDFTNNCVLLVRAQLKGGSQY